MAESFDCPRCGAPVKYNSAEQGNVETISCPYCGESIVVPAEMRPHPPAAPSQFKRLDPELEDLLRLESEEREAKSRPERTDHSSHPYQNDYRVKKKGLGTRILNSIWILGVLIGVVPVVLFVIIPMFYGVYTSIFPAASGPAISPKLATQTASFSAMRDGPVVVQETFSNNKLNWTTGTDNDSQGLVQRDILNGKYSWEIISKKSIGSFSSPDMPALKDIYVSADVQMTTTSHSLQDTAGIIFHNSQQTGVFYYFGVSSNGGYSLSMYDGSGWRNLISATSSSIVNKTGQVNHLAVSMIASVILLQINNQIVGSYTDSNLLSGDAGLGVNVTAGEITTVVTFSNFTVRKAPWQK